MNTLAKSAHIVVDCSKSEIRCEHCGARQPYKLPVSIKDFCKWGDAFRVLHEGCKN